MFSTLQNTQQYGLYSNITSSTLIKTGKGTIQGIIINSHINGTVRFSDAITATTPYMNGTITFNSGEHFIPMFGATFLTGLYASIGGTANLTIIYN